MVTLFGLLIVFLSLQSTEELEQKVQQLREKKEQLQSDLTEVEAAIKNAEQELNKTKATNIAASGQSVRTVLAFETDLLETPSFNAKRLIRSLPKGTDVTLGVLGEDTRFIEAVVEGQRGFVPHVYLKKGPLVTGYIDGLVEARSKADNKDRLAVMVEKWGKELGTIIAERKVRVGMTREQAIDAWGQPKDINKTIRANSLHEQWVYGGSSYLYFEQGILKTIQN